MVTRPTLAQFALLIAMLAVSSIARADSGAVIVSGTSDAKQSTQVTAAVASALRRAKWSLVDARFSSKDVQAIQECFATKEPWPCIDPIASPLTVGKLVLVTLGIDKGNGGIRLTAQYSAESESVTGFKNGYCGSPCNDTALVESSSDLVEQMLSDVLARTGTTFLEIITSPADAVVSIDGGMLAPPVRSTRSSTGAIGCSRSEAAIVMQTSKSMLLQARRSA